MNKSNKNLVINLKARLNELGWRVPDLARESQLSASGLYGVASGDRWPSPDNLDRIAKALRTEVSWLLSDHSKPPVPTHDEDLAERAAEKAVQKLTQGSSKLEQLQNLLAKYPKAAPPRKPKPELLSPLARVVSMLLTLNEHELESLIPTLEAYIQTLGLGKIDSTEKPKKPA